MNVTVLSYQDFAQAMKENDITDDTVKSWDKSIFISILDSEGWFSARQFEQDHHNVLTLQFDDVTESGQPSPTNRTSNTRAFDESDGKKIIELLNRTGNADADYCVVHCAAGISRSGAVGMFVNDYFREDYNEFKTRNWRIMPNELITRTLNNLAR